MTDEQLMRAVRDGDVSRLGVLFERYHLALFDFLSRMTGNAGVAEDLVQDVFVRVLKYRATFRDEGRFETWIYRIARNARVDYFKSRRPSESIDEAALDIPEPGAGLRGDEDAIRRDCRQENDLVCGMGDSWAPGRRRYRPARCRLSGGSPDVADAGGGPGDRRAPRRVAGDAADGQPVAPAAAVSE